MKGNKLAILVAVLAVLIGIIVISNKLGNKKPSEAEQKFFPSLTEQSIGSITINEGENRVKLRKKGDVWVVSKDGGTSPAQTAAAGSLLGTGDSSSAPSPTEAVEYPVDSASITAALEKVTSLKKTALISENPEKQSVFEVDSAKGISVVLSDGTGKTVGSFLIGKSGPDYNSNYIRVVGSNSVYMASGGIRYSFFTDLDRWRDKAIVRFDKTTAKGLTLNKKEGGMITIAHADSGNPWQILEPIQSPAKTDAVNGVLEKLSTLTASDFQDEVIADTAMGFDKPELVVTVSFNNGSSRNIIFGKKNSESKYWVKTDGKDQLFLITEYNVNQINKKLEDLKGEPPVQSISPDSTKKK